MDKRSQNKIKITQDIITSAKTYKSKLVGRTFLYVFDNKFIEVIYRTKDFLHLTGVDTNLSAEAFYKDAVKGRLRHNQIYFTARHPNDLCVQKLSQLKNISAVSNSDMVIFEDVTTSTFVYRFGLSELNFTLCLAEDINSEGIIISDKFVARSLRVEDSFSRSRDAHEILYIFSKKNTDKLYSTINYIDNRVSINDLPIEVLCKIDKQLNT